MSPNRHASCAAASPRTLTILDSPSHARWAARQVTNSLSRSAEGTIARPTDHATSVRGGGRPASIRSKSPASSGGRRTEAASGGLNDRHYLGRMALPRPLTQRQRAGTSARLQRRKKKPTCRIFPTNGPARLAARGLRRCGDLTTPSRRMSRPRSASIRRGNAADHAAALGVTGLLTKPLFRVSKMFAPTERRARPHRQC